MSQHKFYRVVTSVPSSRHNIYTGTTAAPSVNCPAADKGVEATFQNQSTGATDIYVGGSDLAVAIGATSTLGPGGVKLSIGDAYTVGKTLNGGALQMTQFWVVSTSSMAVCTVHLISKV